MKLLCFLLFFQSFLTLAQEQDSIPYNEYRNKIVLYSDLGFSSAPFSIKGDFSHGVDKVKYRHNQKFVLGFGVAYKWFALRLGFSLPGNLRAESRYGKANYQDLGLTFNIKQTYWDIDLRNYLGYVIKDAYTWNDTLNALSPNAKMGQTRSISASINSWYFRSKDFKMNSVLGKTGDFEYSHGTWYIKGTLNIFGSGNDGVPLMPQELVDTTQNIYQANSFSALDFGAVPGYAYVYRWKNWQAAGFGGLGGVIQSKFFTAGTLTRGYLGLAPRMDLRFIVGYSKPRYFLWLHTNFDIKSMRFMELSYRQMYNTIQLVGGFRLDKKSKKERKEK